MRAFSARTNTANHRPSIVFVHGFTGHPRETWALKQKKKAAKKHERDDTAAKPRSKLRRLLSGTGAQSSSHSQSTTTEFSTPEGSDRSASLITSTSNNTRPDNDGKDCEGDVYWPADLAPLTAPDSRILTYGYDSEVRHWVAGQISKKSIYDHANDLLYSLEARRRRAAEKDRLILFVAHSLGGLITKVALRKARDCAAAKPHVHSIYQATGGVVFFGTPHGGADPRSFVHHVISASALFMGFQVNDGIVNSLLPNRERLSDWSHEFLAMCHERGWHVYSFQEEYGVTGLFGKPVVEEESSCLDDPIVETKQHIARNHMDMCRFGRLDDPEYQKVAAAITFIISKTTSEPVGPPEQAAPDDSDLDLQPAETPTRDTPDPQIPPSEAHHGIDAELMESLKAQLYFDKIDERLTTLVAAQGKTCRWFLSSPPYTSWIDPEQKDVHGGFLWIKGNPGTGKSTLMKFLFEDAKAKSRGSPSHITISFFFLARGTVEERSTTGLYRSLLHQLLTKTPDLEGALEWMTVDGARVIERNGWQEEALKQTLRNAVQRLGDRSLTLFIDALDECDKQQVAGMVSFFEELCELAAEKQVLLQICFSSRHYPTVLVRKGIELTLEGEEGQAGDIQVYIRSKLRVGKSKAAQSLMSDIFDKSSRIFLWVVLVLDILNAESQGGAGSIKNMRRRLNDIPKGLEDLFEMILARDSDNLDQLRVCLKWILFAARPLKPPELYFAVQFALDDECDGYWDEDDIDLDQMKTFVRSSSKGLAELTRGKNPNVQFIHESVRDFLLGKYKRHWSGANDNFIGQGHRLLRDCCRAHVLAHFRQPDDVNNVIERLPKMREVIKNYTFLSDANVGLICKCIDRLDYPRLTKEISEGLNAPGGRYSIVPNSLLKLLRDVQSAHPASADYVRNAATTAYPFLKYAVTNLLFHSNSSQQGGVDQGDFLVNFPLSRWITLANLLAVHLVRRYKPSVPLPYLLAERNLADLILAFPRRCLCLEVGEERHGPPLFAAVVTGSAEAAEALINLEPDDDSPFQQRREKFCFKGRQLFMRPDVTFTYKNSTGLLGHALKWGDDLLLEALLSRGVNPNRKPEMVSPPLCIAAREGSVSATKLLLDTRRAIVHAKDTAGRTPLSYAAENGVEALVQQLLDAGATDLGGDKDRLTPLDYAVKSRSKGIIRLLLETGLVDVDNRRIVFVDAVKNRAEDVVEALLYSGRAYFDPQDEGYCTALRWAAMKGDIGVVNLLLDAGAVDTNAGDEMSRTALMNAAETGHEGVVNLLLDSGAVDTNARDVISRTALMYAAINGHEGVVRLLLEVGAGGGDGRHTTDINKADIHCWTALMYAAQNKHEGIVALLRDVGAVAAGDGSAINALL